MLLVGEKNSSSLLRNWSCHLVLWSSGLLNIYSASVYDLSELMKYTDRRESG